MSKLKDLIPDNLWDLPEEKQNKFWLEKEIEAIVSQSKTASGELKDFLEKVTPITGPHYFIFVKDEDTKAYTNIKYNRDDYIKALCCLSDEKYTVFYHTASFNGWIDNESATATRCIYVDIDDIGINANEADIDAVISFLRNTLKLSDNQFPDYAILSGHGLHACWLIDELPADKEEIRAKYTDSMITRLGGDFSGSPISHQFRCPCSYNLKDEIIKGKLFKLTNCTNTDINRLDWCILPPDVIKEYHDKYYARVHEKNLKTKEKNKQLEKEFLEKLGDKSLEDFLSENISAKERKIAEKLLKIKIKKKAAEKIQKYINENDGISDVFTDEDLDTYIYCDKALPYDHLRIYDGYKPQNRTMNLILDLHNFFIRSKGVLVSRNMYFTILASLFKHKGESERAAIKWCQKYVDELYHEEMVETVLNVYRSDKTYRFSNEKIARLLCFSPEDISESYCHFSEVRRAEAKKARNKNSYERKRIRENKMTPAEKREIHIEFLKKHPDIKEKEALKKLGIGRSTFYKLKKTVRDDSDSPKN